jgi:hypothetical protein
MRCGGRNNRAGCFFNGVASLSSRQRLKSWLLNLEASRHPRHAMRSTTSLDSVASNRQGKEHTSVPEPKQCPGNKQEVVLPKVPARGRCTRYHTIEQQTMASSSSDPSISSCPAVLTWTRYAAPSPSSMPVIHLNNGERLSRLLRLKTHGPARRGAGAGV